MLSLPMLDEDAEKTPLSLCHLSGRDFLTEPAVMLLLYPSLECTEGRWFNYLQHMEIKCETQPQNQKMSILFKSAVTGRFRIP